MGGGGQGQYVLARASESDSLHFICHLCTRSRTCSYFFKFFSCYYCETGSLNLSTGYGI